MGVWKKKRIRKSPMQYVDNSAKPKCDRWGTPLPLIEMLRRCPPEAKKWPPTYNFSCLLHIRRGTKSAPSCKMLAFLPHAAHSMHELFFPDIPKPKYISLLEPSLLGEDESLAHLFLACLTCPTTSCAVLVSKPKPTNDPFPPPSPKKCTTDHVLFIT